MADYPAGTIDVRGTLYPVTVDDRGTWICDAGGTKHHAGTKDALRDAVMTATLRKAAKIEIPFCKIDWSRTFGWQVHHGTVTGIHQGTGNLLVTWDNGRKEQLRGYTGTVTLRPLTPEEEQRWAELCETKRTWSNALADFEAEHNFSLNTEAEAAVKAAVAEAMASG